MEFGSALAKSLRHPLSVIGYSIFFAAHIYEQTPSNELAYMFYVLAALSIIGGFVLACKQAPKNARPVVMISRNEHSEITGNKILSDASINDNRSSVVSDNKIG